MNERDIGLLIMTIMLSSLFVLFLVCYWADTLYNCCHHILKHWCRCCKKKEMEPTITSQFTELCLYRTAISKPSAMRPPSYYAGAIATDLSIVQAAEILELDIDRHEASHSTTPTSGFRTLSSVSHYSMASSFEDWLCVPILYCWGLQLIRLVSVIQAVCKTQYYSFITEAWWCYYLLSRMSSLPVMEFTSCWLNSSSIAHNALETLVEQMGLKHV